MPSSSTEVPSKMLLAKYHPSKQTQTDNKHCALKTICILVSWRGLRLKEGLLQSLRSIYFKVSDPSFINGAKLGKSFNFSESISHLNNRTRIPIPVLPISQGNYEHQMGSFMWKCFLNLKVLHKCEECEAKTPLSNQFQCHVNITLRKLSPAPETFKRHIILAFLKKGLMAQLRP